MPNASAIDELKEMAQKMEELKAKAIEELTSTIADLEGKLAEAREQLAEITGVEAAGAKRGRRPAKKQAVEAETPAPVPASASEEN